MEKTFFEMTLRVKLNNALERWRRYKKFECWVSDLRDKTIIVAPYAYFKGIIPGTHNPAAFLHATFYRQDNRVSERLIDYFMKNLKFD